MTSHPHIAYVLYNITPKFLGNGISLCVKNWSELLSEKEYRVKVVGWFDDPRETVFNGNCTFDRMPSFRMLPGRFTLANDVLRAFRLARHISSSPTFEDVDIVDIQWPAMYIFIFKQCERKSIKKMHTVHLTSLGGEPRYTGYRLKQNRYLNVEAGKRSDGIIVVSNWVKQLYAERGLSTEKIHVVNNSVPVIERSNNDKGKTDCFQYIWVGRFDQAKRVLLAIEAALGASAQNPRLTFTFVGTGPMFERARARVLESGNTAIKLLGHISDAEEMKRLWLQSDAYFFTTCHETFGRTLAEAMGAGLPCISTDLPVLKEVMGDTGLYYKLDNKEELVGRMIELSFDEAKQRDLSKKAQQRAQDLYSQERISEQLCAAYQSVLV